MSDTPIVTKVGRVLQIFEPIYKQVFFYDCAPTYSEHLQWLKKDVKISDENMEIDKMCDGEFMGWDSEFGAVGTIWTKNKNLELLVHECLHAAVYDMAMHGMPVNEHNDEQIAYLQCFLFTLIRENRDAVIPCKKRPKNV